MRIRTAGILGAVLMTIATSTSAQNVINADNAAVQPTVRRDDKGFASCGVRVIAQVILPKEMETFDFSLNLDSAAFLGLLKAGKYFIPGNARIGWDIEKRVTVAPGPSTFWFAEQSADVPLTPLKVAKSDSAGFALGVAEFDRTASTIIAIINGKVVQFAVRYPSENLDRVISFKSDMAQADKDTFFACWDGMRRRLEREVESAK